MVTAETPTELAERIGVPGVAFAETLAETQRLAARQERDVFGRSWSAPPLAPPYSAVRVEAALFHTQGGLVTDRTARVLRGGTPMENLYAAGGAAVGVSGPTAAGYLAGNGLLTAVVMGRIAGAHAAAG